MNTASDTYDLRNNLNIFDDPASLGLIGPVAFSAWYKQNVKHSHCLSLVATLCRCGPGGRMDHPVIRRLQVQFPCLHGKYCYLYVCVWERERERERRGLLKNLDYRNKELIQNAIGVIWLNTFLFCFLRASPIFGTITSVGKLKKIRYWYIRHIHKQTVHLISMVLFLLWCDSNVVIKHLWQRCVTGRIFYSLTINLII